jgi:hypothetical protein
MGRIQLSLALPLWPHSPKLEQRMVARHAILPSLEKQSCRQEAERHAVTTVAQGEPVARIAAMWPDVTADCLASSRITPPKPMASPIPPGLVAEPQNARATHVSLLRTSAHASGEAEPIDRRLPAAGDGLGSNAHSGRDAPRPRPGCPKGQADHAARRSAARWPGRRFDTCEIDLPADESRVSRNPSRLRPVRFNHTVARANTNVIVVDQDALDS